MGAPFNDLLVTSPNLVFIGLPCHSATSSELILKSTCNNDLIINTSAVRTYERVNRKNDSMFHEVVGIACQGSHKTLEMKFHDFPMTFHDQISDFP